MPLETERAAARRAGLTPLAAAEPRRAQGGQGVVRVGRRRREVVVREARLMAVTRPQIGLGMMPTPRAAERVVVTVEVVVQTVEPAGQAAAARTVRAMPTSNASRSRCSACHS